LFVGILFNGDQADDQTCANDNQKED
jgi:hypothetical protein